MMLPNIDAYNPNNFYDHSCFIARENMKIQKDVEVLFLQKARRYAEKKSPANWQTGSIARIFSNKAKGEFEKRVKESFPLESDANHVYLNLIGRRVYFSKTLPDLLEAGIVGHRIQKEVEEIFLQKACNYEENNSPPKGIDSILHRLSNEAYEEFNKKVKDKYPSQYEQDDAALVFTTLPESYFSKTLPGLLEAELNKYYKPRSS